MIWVLHPHQCYLESQENIAGALMITASHNPLNWNGLKMIINGRGLFEEDLDKVLKTKIQDHTTYWSIF